MRGKLYTISVLLVCVTALSACARVIRTPADELSLYRWRGELDNGDSAELSFDGDDASLELKGEGLALTLCGNYALTDDTLVICDRASGMHYSFGYRLFGDRVELSSDGGAVSLDKKETEG